MSRNSSATSAQYAQPCPACKAGPYNPCRAKSGRVTERLDAPKRAYVPANDQTYEPYDETNWKAVEECDETCHHPVHAFGHPERLRHLESVEVIIAEGVPAPSGGSKQPFGWYSMKRRKAS